MAEQLLNASQVRSSFQQVSCSRMAEAVRAQVGRPGDMGQQLVHDPADGPRVHPTAAGAIPVC